MSTYTHRGEVDALIPIEDIKAPNMRQRGLPRIDTIRELIQNGTPLPAVGVYNMNGQLYLTAGAHRHAAAKELGLTHLPCVYWNWLITDIDPADYE
jgi:ParB-like chromosome segregation protein Spo0J